MIFSKPVQSCALAVMCLGAGLWLFSGELRAQIESEPLPPFDDQTDAEDFESETDDPAPFDMPVSEDTQDTELRTDTLDEEDSFGPVFSPRMDADTSNAETIDAGPNMRTRQDQEAEPSGPIEISERRAKLRALEKITARIMDLDIGLNETVEFKSLEITMRTCNKRPPEETPETTAFLEIVDNKPNGDVENVFTGWMFASSPALNALEHPVYDVWVIDCNISEPDASTGNL